ncbi:hypothetical protein H9P43_000996 [Blastocladiella emersonii ATCC 22665]|nr:hypothetical protein H9P43_000996 [Blastocladiella emersonii ATCC 22665]
MDDIMDLNEEGIIVDPAHLKPVAEVPVEAPVAAMSALPIDNVLSGSASQPTVLPPAQPNDSRPKPSIYDRLAAPGPAVPLKREHDAADATPVVDPPRRAPRRPMGPLSSRLFGVINNTLQQADRERARHAPQDAKFNAIQERIRREKLELEAKLRAEATHRRERSRLERDVTETRAELDRLHALEGRAELPTCLETAAAPGGMRIFWRPSKHTPETRALLEAQVASRAEDAVQRIATLEHELAAAIYALDRFLAGEPAGDAGMDVDGEAGVDRSRTPEPPKLEPSPAVDHAHARTVTTASEAEDIYAMAVDEP